MLLPVYPCTHPKALRGSTRKYKSMLANQFDVSDSLYGGKTQQLCSPVWMGRCGAPVCQSGSSHIYELQSWTRIRCAPCLPSHSLLTHPESAHAEDGQCLPTLLRLKSSDKVYCQLAVYDNRVLAVYTGTCRTDPHSSQVHGTCIKHASGVTASRPSLRKCTDHLHQYPFPRQYAEMQQDSWQFS